MNKNYIQQQTARQVICRLFLLFLFFNFAPSLLRAQNQVYWREGFTQNTTNLTTTAPAVYTTGYFTTGSGIWWGKNIYLTSGTGCPTGNFHIRAKNIVGVTDSAELVSPVVSNGIQEFHFTRARANRPYSVWITTDTAAQTTNWTLIATLASSLSTVTCTDTTIIVASANAKRLKLRMSQGLDTDIDSIWLTSYSAIPSFTPGNLLIHKVGSGNAQLTNMSNSSKLIQITTSGVIVDSLPVPVTGPSKMVIQGSASNDGQITLSTDYQKVILYGYNADTGIAAVSGVIGVNRIVLGVDSYKNIVELASGPSTGNGRCAASNGSNVWVVGSNGGMFAGLGPGGTGLSDSITTTTVNFRSVAIYNNQLYYSTASGTKGIYKVGNGTPTTGPVSSTLMIATPSFNPNQFSINADTSICYVTDDAAPGGLRKYARSGSVWTQVDSANIGQLMRALTVDWSKTNPEIYATISGTSVVKIVDIGSSLSTQTITTLYTAPPNTAVRGVSFTPGSQINGGSTPSAPTVTLSGSTTSFSTCAGTASATQSISISGSNLTAFASVLAPAGFEVSFSSSSNFADSIGVNHSSGTLATTTVYVRLKSSATGSPSGNITLKSAGATNKTLAISGTANVIPTITLGSIGNVTTSATSFNIPYSATTGSPDKYSLTAGSPVAMSGFSAVSNATLGSSPIAVTIPASAANTYNFNLRLTNTTTGCMSDTVKFTLTVGTASPSLSITSYSPQSGNVGSTVTISGTGFVNVTKVWFGAAPAASFTVVNNTTITAVVPNNAYMGNIAVATTAGFTIGKEYYYVKNPQNVFIGNNNQTSSFFIKDGKLYGNYVYDFDNGTSYRFCPVEMPLKGSLRGKIISQLSNSGAHYIFLASDNTVHIGGNNSFRRLGDSTAVSRRAMTVEITNKGDMNGKTIVQVLAGTSTSYALSSDGQVFSWGQDTLGMLGNGTSNGIVPVPVNISNQGSLVGKNIIKLCREAGSNYYNNMFAIASDGTIHAWGSNYNGTIGNGSNTPVEVPISIEQNGALNGKTIVEIYAGIGATLFLDKDGIVYGCGSGANIGAGSGSKLTPVVTDTTSTSSLQFKKVLAILSSGNSGTGIMIDTAGKVHGTGNNSYGTIGDNTTNFRNAPILTEAVTSSIAGKVIVGIAQNNGNTYALASDNTFHVWGFALNYGLMNGLTTPNALKPQALTIRTGPSADATNLNISNITGTTATISCTPGSGVARMIVVKANKIIDTVAPVNGMNYTANSNMTGSTIDTTGKVVYKGFGNSVNVTGLVNGTTYHVSVFEYDTFAVPCAYDIYKLGTPLMGSFTASSGPVAPTVSTTAASAIAQNSATLGGNVTAQGSASVTERGVVYATTTSPTTSSNKVQIGSGTGVFSQSVSGLSASTTYYVRAYAINTAGTSYGNEVSFSTSAASTIQVPVVSSIQPDQAFIGSIVTIKGIGFGETTSGAKVNFNGVDGVINSLNDSVITVSVPLNAVHGKIIVRNLSNGLSAESVQDFKPLFAPEKISLDNTHFLPRKSFSGMLNMDYIASSDLDGDGKTDIAGVSRYLDSSIAIWRNQSTPGQLKMDPVYRIPFSNSLRRIDIADLDGDNKPEIIVTHPSDTAIYIVPNLSTPGTLSFGTPIRLKTNLNPFNIGIADMDGNGKPDLAIPNQLGNTLHIFRNNSTPGNLSFVTQVKTLNLSSPTGILFSDMDKDNKADLGISFPFSHKIRFYKNTSTSDSIRFDYITELVTDSFPRDITCSDINEDGRIEIFVQNSTDNSNPATIYTNRSSNGFDFTDTLKYHFGSRIRGVYFNNLDGDSLQDIIYMGTDTMYFMLNRGYDKSFNFEMSGTALFKPTAGNGMEISDIDGDFKADIIYGGFNDNTGLNIRRHIYPISNNLPGLGSSLCSPGVPNPLLGTTVVNFYNRPFTYKWISSATQNGVYLPAGGADTLKEYSPAFLNATVYYKRVYYWDYHADTSVFAVVNVVNLTTNSINGTQEVNNGQPANPLNGNTIVAPSVSYLWISSTDSLGTYAAAGGTNNTINYDPGVLSQTMYFKRVVSSGSCIDTSDIVVVYVKFTGIGNNIISSNQIICSGNKAQLLTGSIAQGGIRPYQYLWIQSDNGNFTNPVVAAGIATDSIYDPGFVLQTTWFKRIVKDANFTDTSNAISITVNTSPRKPRIVLTPENTQCKGTQNANFGTDTLPAAGVSFTWSTLNATLLAHGTTQQYALVSFPEIGTARVIVTAFNGSCSAIDTVAINVETEEAHTATVRYFNNSFVCEANQVKGYQWGFDERQVLKPHVLGGEINQNYRNNSPDFTNNSYWVISNKGNCYQKTYYNLPNSLHEITNTGLPQVYPNPVTDVLHVEIPTVINTALDIQLLDINGRVIQTYSTKSNSFEMPVGELGAGVYLLQFSSEGQYLGSTRIVKHN